LALLRDAEAGAVAKIMSASDSRGRESFVEGRRAEGSGRGCLERDD
jgi:hypothetical protein